MPSSLKGWVAFIIVTLILLGGVFSWNHVFPAKASGITITGISASSNSSFSGTFDAANATFMTTVDNSSSTAYFTVTLVSSVSSGPLNISIRPGYVINMSKFNSTFANIFSKVNATVKNTTLATTLATTYTYQNITYALYQPINVTGISLSGGSATFHFSLSLNKTALENFAAGDISVGAININYSSYGDVGAIVFTMK
ncbi:MAG: hypothetical protein LVQ96_04640 [Thermoplasmatales archaeon]|nr:hypothetical protein [Thermoplasmatales archaeon]MCW6170443.1 hypothetical protein [Thermoplasmatales archaeon]